MIELLAFVAAVTLALGLGELAVTSPVLAGVVILALFLVGCFTLGPFDPRA